MSQAPIKKKPTKFISLRLQLLVGFTLVFSGVFAGAYYWFYKFATDTALNRIEEDLIDTMKAAARGVDGDMLLSLSRQKAAIPQGYTDVHEPRYWSHVKWLATVEHIEPRAYVYTYVAGPKPNTVVFIGSGSAANTDRQFDGAKFLQYYEPKTKITAGLMGLTVNPTPYRDRWGSWITGYMPVRNSSGRPLTAIGIDFKADYVIEVQNKIRQQMIFAFAVTYGTLFILVYIGSEIVTKPVTRLTKVAERIAEGDYEQNLSPLHNRRIDDEMSTLARVFKMMVDKVRQREETLKQQVAELKIEIDQTKRQKQVNEIIDSDFFQDLQSKARRIRNRNRNDEPETPVVEIPSDASLGS